ncbi:ureE [Acrasis kona]|uniref:UreE n=1 Tax=Acrasis kona TaxID=1008807 RepID=A0AAW2Z957_9EUKA
MNPTGYVQPQHAVSSLPKRMGLRSPQVILIFAAIMLVGYFLVYHLLSKANNNTVPPRANGDNKNTNQEINHIRETESKIVERERPLETSYYYKIPSSHSHEHGGWLSDLIIHSSNSSSIMSTAKCIGKPSENYTCAIENAFFGPTSASGRFHFLLDVSGSQTKEEIDGKISKYYEYITHLDPHPVGSAVLEWKPIIVPFVKYSTKSEASKNASPTFQYPQDHKPSEFVRHSGPSYYYAQMCPFNIGHTIFDDYLAFISVINDLGYSPNQYNDWTLLQDNPSAYHDHGCSRIVCESHKAITTKPPVIFKDLKVEIAQNQKVHHFQQVTVGAQERGAHVHQRDWAPRSRANHNVWKLRNHYIKNFGITDSDWTKNRPNKDEPLQVILLNKSDKRVVKNMDEIVAHLQSTFDRTGQTNTRVVCWETLKVSHKQELEMLVKTHILFGIDGTGSNVNVFLPPGSVFISGGMGLDKQAGHLADFLFASYEHIRVLYYTNYTSDDIDGHHRETNLRIDPLKFEAYMKKAIDLVRNGYQTPVSLDDNQSDFAKICRRLFNRYPELSDAERPHYDHCMCSRIVRNPDAMYRQLVGRDPPKDFLEYAK